MMVGSSLNKKATAAAIKCGVPITEDGVTVSSVFQPKIKEETQMNLDDFRNSTYLTQRDIDKLPPKERHVTVDRIEAEKVGEDKDLKLVTYFVSLEKGLVTNITNGEVLAEIAVSTDTDDWHGAHVEIYVDPDVRFGGERKGGIRLRSIPTKKSQSVEEEYDEEIAFGDEEVP